MIFRIFIGILVMVIAVLLLGIYQTRNLHHDIFDAPEGATIVSENADLTIVEFLSYSCLHCRNAHTVVLEALQKDGKIRYVPRPLIPDDDKALMATKLVYAAGVQSQFIPAHNQIMQNYETFDEQAIQGIALELGLDAQKLEEDMANPDILNRAKQNTSMFLALGGNSTPYFLAEDGTLLTPQNGPITIDDLIRLFSHARKNL